MDKSYSQPEECLLAGDAELGGAYIVRLPCGDSNDYLRCAFRKCCNTVTIGGAYYAPALRDSNTPWGWWSACCGCFVSHLATIS